MTKTDPKIRLKTKEWHKGERTVYGEKVRIPAQAAGVGPVALIYERTGRTKYRFHGVERASDNPKSEFAGDLPMVVENLGPSVVARTTYRRIYDEWLRDCRRWD